MRDRPPATPTARRNVPAAATLLLLLHGLLALVGLALGGIGLLLVAEDESSSGEMLDGLGTWLGIVAIGAGVVLVLLGVAMARLLVVGSRRAAAGDPRLLRQAGFASVALGVLGLLTGLTGTAALGSVLLAAPVLVPEIAMIALGALVADAVRD